MCEVDNVHYHLSVEYAGFVITEGKPGPRFADTPLFLR